MEVWGYQKNSTKLAVTLLAVLLSGGMLGLLLYWVERYWLYCTANQSSLKDANFVLVVVSVFRLFTFRELITVKDINTWVLRDKGFYATKEKKTVKCKVVLTNCKSLFIIIISLQTS